MKEGKKITITVCMGSSCFARGNDQNLAAIEKFLRSNKLEDSVDLRGARCEGKCAAGPHVKINGKTCSELSSDRLKEELIEALRG